MKVAHILPNHKIFTNMAISFLKEEMYSYCSSIVILDRTPTLDSAKIYSCSDNVLYVPGSFEEEKKYIDRVFLEFDLVCFHSLSISIPMKMHILIRHKEWIDKCIWIEWGYDLFLDYPQDLVGFAKFLGKKILIRQFERKIPFFFAIHPSDQDAYYDNVKGNALVQYIPYKLNGQSVIDESEYASISIKHKLLKGEPLSIMIGHRAWTSLHHRKWLKVLHRFYRENIRIILPLNYGDVEYGNRIEKYAYQLFGGKVIVLRDIMPLKDYRDMLKDVDIFILDSTRQVALGNIYTLMRLQKKIYMPKSNNISRYFQNMGISFCDITSLDKCSYNELAMDVNMSGAALYMREFDNQDHISMWKKGFERIVKTQSISVEKKNSLYS